MSLFVVVVVVVVVGALVILIIIVIIVVAVTKFFSVTGTCMCRCGFLVQSFACFSHWRMTVALFSVLIFCKY